MGSQQAVARRVCLLSGAVGLFCATAAVAVVTFDGVLQSGPGQEWANSRGYSLATNVQTNHTGFGDQHRGPGGFAGSELDELFMRTDGNFLYIGVTGNLEQNTNTIAVFLDVPDFKPGGQNVLATEIAPRSDEAPPGACPASSNGPPRSVQGLGHALERDDNGTPENTADDITQRGTQTGTSFDAGFLPDYAFAMDTNGGTVHVTQYALGDPDPAPPLGIWDDPATPLGGAFDCNFPPNETLPYYTTRTFRGTAHVNGGAGALSGGNGSTVAFNNKNKLGVTAEAVLAPGSAPTGTPPGDPRSATSGLEMKIALSEIGVTGPFPKASLRVKVNVMLISGGGDDIPDVVVSNQVLPGIGVGASAADLPDRPDFTTFTTGGDGGNSGLQFADRTLTAAPFGASMDGQNIVSDFGLASLIASQDSVTSFGDRDCTTLTDGSEMDELYIRTDENNLYIGLTGNLDANGNAFVLFVDHDTTPGHGQTSLKTEIAPTAGSCQGNGPPSVVQNLGQALSTNQSTGATERSSDPATTILDAGFEPETALHFDTANGVINVTQYTLGDPNAPLGTWDDPGTPNDDDPDCSAGPIESLPYFATRVYRGSAPYSGGALSVAVTWSVAFNNDGINGVSNTAVAGAGTGQAGDPRTQTRGLEAKIPLADLAIPAGPNPLTFKVMALLANGSGFVSNQTLPGLGRMLDTANLGNRPSFPTEAGGGVGGNGLQYATVTRTPAAFSPVLDGQNIVSEFSDSGSDFVNTLVASQDTVTGFQNRTEVTVTDCDEQLFDNGSEIDQIFVREELTPAQLLGEVPVPGLAIGITGNLEKNGNNIVIFLDTQPGGEMLLAGNPARLDGNNGDTVPLEADYAVLINQNSTDMFVDFFDLTANTILFIGSDPAAGGNGVLSKDGTDNVMNWRAIVNNTNIDGVTSDGGQDPQSTNALTATNGFELIIPRSVIGSPPDGSSICVFAMITGNNADRFLSNQFLPALAGGGQGNFGNGPGGAGVNLMAAGYQCLSVPLGGDCNDPRFDADGDGDVDPRDFAEFQKCYTGSGGSPEAPLYPPACECYDWGGLIKNGNINDEDFGAFQFCATRDKLSAIATCDDPPE